MRQGRAFSYEGALPIFFALALETRGGEASSSSSRRRRQKRWSVSPHFERNAGSPGGRLLVQMSLTMSDCTQLKTWISIDMKERFAGLARSQGLSESAMLKRLVDLMLRTAGAGEAPAIPAPRGSPRGGSRLTVRLRSDDRILLRERAAARGMPQATYVSVLTRAHLRGLAPLPKEELLALRRAVSELGSIGRTLNQIARAANQGERVSGPGREDLKAMLRMCGGLRDHVKGLLTANVRSWEQGHGEPV
jgi:hypothetical protein